MNNASQEHLFRLALQWTGNCGQGTINYRAYERAYQVQAEGKPLIYGSSDPAFRGDAAKYNPEELLVAAISSCHMLWYLHLCADAGVIVVAYSDRPVGKMQVAQNGSGRFVEVILKPEIAIASENKLQLATELHHQAHEFCFIANSVNFPIECQPVIQLQTL